jgi:tellurite resistance protein TerC
MAAIVWIGFIGLVLGMLALDLGVFHREDHAISFKEAVAWSVVWTVLALAFNLFVYFLYEHHWLGFGSAFGLEVGGGKAALQFFTGYVLERSLSVDNIFVIAMVFSYFAVPLAYQHRVLFWGILGALVMRGVMILIGAALIARFAWMVYLFGGLLLVTAVKLLVTRHDNLEPSRNPIVRLVRRIYPVTDEFVGHRFITDHRGRRAVTPLFIALIVVETSDLIFAVDSIPAIFAITHDPFIVFTSNIFAILGMRAMYFLLAGVIDRFRYLKMSLAFVLAFVGVKMILAHHHPIPIVVSLSIIAGILGVGIAASVYASGRDTAALVSPLADELERLARVGIRQARRIVILIVGSTVLFVGVVMIVLPGPAVLVIPGGLAILAIEFVWARRWLCRIRLGLEQAKEAIGLAARKEEIECGPEGDTPTQSPPGA